MTLTYTYHIPMITYIIILLTGTEINNRQDIPAKTNEGMTQGYHNEGVAYINGTDAAVSIAAVLSYSQFRCYPNEWNQTHCSAHSSSKDIITHGKHNTQTVIRLPFSNKRTLVI